MNTESTNHGTPSHLTRLWMDAQPSVLSFICAAIPRFHDAEDVLQEVAVDIADNFDRYDPSRPFVAWAIGIARRKIAQHFRSHQRDSLLIHSEMLESVAEAHVQRHDQLDERREALGQCLEELDSKAQDVIRMRYSENLHSPEIAQQLDSTSGSVRVMLTRIRTKLNDCIESKIASGGSK